MKWAMDKVRLTIERLIWRGRGLSRLPSGKIALVSPGIFPGEEIEGVVSKDKKDYVEVTWTCVRRPHPLREVHPCSLADRCGGCRFGSIPQSLQVDIKQELLASEIRRALGPSFASQAEDNVKFFPSPSAWRYRWRGQVFVYQGHPHVRQFQSHQLIPLDDCLLLSQTLSEKIREMCRELPEGRQTIAASPADHQVCSVKVSQTLRLPIADYGLFLYLPTNVFFQANWELNQSLIRYVCGQLNGVERIADLYAGAGNFALPLACQSEQVLAVESNPQAVAAADRSAAIADLQNIAFRTWDIAQSDLVHLLGQFGIQALVIDPPRLGIGKAWHSVARWHGLDKIVWISCDIVNTCRDLKPFIQAGWEIREMALFDMFPQTWHMEVVFVLEKGRS
jgi:23S rRNA (uracil1939-C5)-methyltransferase